MNVCPACGACADDEEPDCVNRGHPRARLARPGSTWIAGKYRLDRLLARGDRGAVFVAHHPDLERRVAVKLLPADSVAGPEARERFARRARAVARIDHPAVAGLYDFGVLDGGDAFAAMELVDGETVRNLLDRSGPLSIGEAAALGRRVAEGIAAAHAGGVIHGGLEAADVVLPPVPNRFQTAKITGFPLAEPDPRGRSDGALADPHRDVRALGALLYETLEGRPAPRGAAPRDAGRRREEPPPAPGAMRSDLPAELARLIEQCLSADPDRRPEGATEVAARLRPFAVGALSASAQPASNPQPRPVAPGPPAAPSAASVSPPAAIAPPEDQGTRPTAAPARSPRSTPPRPAQVYAALLGGLVVAALLLWLVVEVTPGRRVRSPGASPPAAGGVRKEAPAPAAPPVREEPAASLAAPNRGAAVSVPARSAPTSLPRSADPNADLRDALEAWIAATNARDFVAHMRFYMPRLERFYLRRDVSRDFVRGVKRELFEGARAIDVSTSEPDIAVSSDGRSATMRFRKKYDIAARGGERRGEVVQELRWVRTPEGWKIASERDAKVLK